MNISRLTAPYFMRRKGHQNYLEKLRASERNQWKSPEELRALQHEKLVRLLEIAGQKVPYYRDCFSSLGLTAKDIATRDVLARLPLLSKDTLVERQDELIADGLRKDELLNKRTSGSTGKPLTIYYDKARADDSWAYNTRHNRWAGVDWGSRVASLWSKPVYALATRSSSALDSFKQTLSGSITEFYQSPYGYTDEDFQGFAKLIADERLKSLIGYSQTVLAFAQFLSRKNIALVRLNSVICGGEALSDHEVQQIEDTFSAKVYRRYGSRETDIIASECGEGTLHCNDDNILIETIPEPGVDGARCVVTDLNNFAMPLIRYDLGDIIMPREEPCRCGRGLSMIHSVRGRLVDHFTAANGKRYSGFWFKAIMQDFDKLEQYQLRQKTSSQFEVLVVPRTNDLGDMFELIESKIMNEFGAATEVDIKIVDKIAQESSSKFRYIISDVS